MNRQTAVHMSLLVWGLCALVGVAQSPPQPNAPPEHWGSPTEGFQLSIRLERASFTNGEPVLACVTLRNISDRVLSFFVGPSPQEKDTKLVLMKGDKRILGVDDPKAGDTFQERLNYIRRGSSPGALPIQPGSEQKFYRDLSKVFDLGAGGAYTARAERRVAVRGIDRTTNVISGAVNFEIRGPATNHLTHGLSR